MELSILYEDQAIIVCEKPENVPSQSDKTNDLDMVNWIKNVLYERENKTNPYVGLIHRLDRPVGGIMVFGKTPQATKELNKQLQQQDIHKKYYAVVTSKVEQKQEPVLLEHYLVKDGRTNTSKVVSKGVANAKLARLLYEVKGTCQTESGQEVTLLEVTLLTGRHHQIRVQLAKEFGGIWGDTKYNPLFQQKRGYNPIALFSYSLEFQHPVTKKKLTYTIEPKKEPFTLFF